MNIVILTGLFLAALAIIVHRHVLRAGSLDRRYGIWEQNHLYRFVGRIGMLTDTTDGKGICVEGEVWPVKLDSNLEKQHLITGTSLRIQRAEQGILYATLD